MFSDKHSVLKIPENGLITEVRWSVMCAVGKKGISIFKTPTVCQALPLHTPLWYSQQNGKSFACVLLSRSWIEDRRVKGQSQGDTVPRAEPRVSWSKPALFLLKTVLPSFLCFSLLPFLSSYLLPFFSNLFFILCWSMVDLYCVSFRCTAKWISYTYTYICSFSDSFPILVITEYWRLFFLNEGSFLKQCWQIQYLAKWRR